MNSLKVYSIFLEVLTTSSALQGYGSLLSTKVELTELWLNGEWESVVLRRIASYFCSLSFYTALLLSLILLIGTLIICEY